MTSSGVAKGRYFAVILEIFLVTTFSQGIIRSLGIFQGQLEADIGLTTSESGLAAGFATGFVFFFAPLVSLVYRMLRNPRPVTLVGAFCTSCGAIFSSLSPTPVIFCLCFALFGLGSSVVFVSSILTLKGVANDRFHVMYGIATSGYAFGSLFLPITAEYLQSIYGWRGAMLILGALSGNMIPFAIAQGPSSFPGEQESENGPLTEESGTETGVYSFSSEFYSDSSSDSADDDMSSTDNLDSEKLRTRERLQMSFEDEIDVDSDQGSTGTYSLRLTDRMKEIRMGEHTTMSYASGKEANYKTDKSRHQRMERRGFCTTLHETLSSCGSLWEPCLVTLTFSYFVMGIEVAGWRFLFVPRAIDGGLSLPNVHILDLTVASATFISRLTLGFVLRKSGNTTTVLLCLVIIEEVSKFLDVFVPQFPVMLLCSFLSGIALEAMAFLPVILGAELLLVPENFDVLFGILEMLQGVGILAGGAISGLIAGELGYNTAYLALATTNGVTFLLVIILKLCERRTGTS
ncbi:monocarboxylate transporter 7-like [Lytechinus variegatus]|uniref:monocarboxylate transporter 7-like n=1 Tax=Lytechinus variegatus TaxID=7654 RepID=UPI001BB18CA9|nr:monocarboxylate transporter 7-like [Lytechinus variegatus]